ncbi:MAG: type II secretion system protein [Phycisphaerae bacterium]|nr:type II secretion system protein [Phycisphaerae bacterium]
MKINHKNRISGVTLIELMVAVGIMTMMLAITGMVFKSASDASGKALSNNDLMQQRRIITQQLDKDFAGLLNDMPFAISFQRVAIADPTPDYPRSGDETWIRRDKIVFYTSGDLQSVDGNVQGNTAKVFYGLMGYLEDLGDYSGNTTPNGQLEMFADYSELIGYPPNMINTEILEDNYDYHPIDNPQGIPYPPREIMVRNQSIVLPIEYNPIITDPGYCLNSARFLTLEECKDTALLTRDMDNYYLDTTSSQPVYVLNYDPDVIANSSGVTSLYYECMTNRDFINKPLVEDPSIINLQRFLMGSDVSSISIQYSKTDPVTKQTTWYPNDHDFMPAGAMGAVYYWNTNTSGTFPSPNGADWIPGGTFPTELKFTITLHDQDRRHFPQGQTFSYIVKLPQR